MDINQILQEVDTLYEENRGPDAEQVMLGAITEAAELGDNGALLQLLNELLGYYRETSQVENSYAIAMQAMHLAQQMGLEDSIPYATTLLNVANAYRAGGRLGESLELYLQVRGIYDKTLSKDNMLVASFENNLSLLYQELGDFISAKEALLKALRIVEIKEAEFEIAVTYANLAGTCVQLNELAEAEEYGERAVREFERMQVEDTHYCAALSALGSCYYAQKQYEKALGAFEKALAIMEKNPARTEYYRRLQERCEACRMAMKAKEGMHEGVCCVGEYNLNPDRETLSGLALCRRYYEKWVKPMIEQEFPAYADKIAVGLVGEGSDCFGYDDVVSRDHDFGPDVCLWVTEETFDEIGKQLEEAYAKLPAEYEGIKRTVSMQGKGRRGVCTIPEFYKRFLGTDKWEEIDWQQVPDSALAAVINGEVFADEEGIFSDMRKQLQKGYRLKVLYLKLAQAAALFSQNAQYNFPRMYGRGDMLAAGMLLADGLKEALKLQLYLEGKYPPHDKWLNRSVRKSEKGRYLSDLANKCMLLWAECRVSDGQEPMQSVQQIVEEIAGLLARRLYDLHFISDTDAYLDAHTAELVFKASIAEESVEELAERIAKLEFEAFDKVENEGGRASCQNDWATFRIMRMSQYLTWNHTMLLQYLYDFTVEYQKGHNLITEKYGRMMEYTDKAAYEKIKEHFPILSEEKKAVIEQIAEIQVAWMEEFAAEYPHLADNARSIHSYEDHRYNTSYETYLRGELGTYSDKMLQLYGRYVVEYAGNDKNLTYDIMSHSVRMYGYKDLQAAEDFWAK